MKLVEISVVILVSGIEPRKAFPLFKRVPVAEDISKKGQSQIIE